MIDPQIFHCFVYVTYLSNQSFFSLLESSREFCTLLVQSVMRALPSVGIEESNCGHKVRLLIRISHELNFPCHIVPSYQSLGGWFCALPRSKGPKLLQIWLHIDINRLYLCYACHAFNGYHSLHPNHPRPYRRCWNTRLSELRRYPARK